jgi:hypothetical protein
MRGSGALSEQVHVALPMFREALGDVELVP